MWTTLWYFIFVTVHTLCLAQLCTTWFYLHTLVVHALCLDQFYCCTFILKESVHENLKTSDNIEWYPLMQPIDFFFGKNFFTNSYSSSGQNMVHIRGSVTTHPLICNNPSRVCSNPSGVCTLQNTDCGCGVTDSGWAVTDHWMGRYRPLDVPHILAGTAAALF